MTDTERRFGSGQNWLRFLTVLGDDRTAKSEMALMRLADAILYLG